MKLITILVEQASVEGLSTALPQTGVASVTISEVERFTRDAVAVEVYRVEMLVDDHAVDYVMAGLSFAVSAGLMGQCKGAWLTEAQELIELSSAAERLVSA